MRHHRGKSDFVFTQEPIEFNKYTDKQFLQYCLGATIYMPGTKDIASTIIQKKWPELTTMVMCFEDAIPEENLERAEQNVLDTLERLSLEIDNGNFDYNDLPLFIIRVRNVDQFSNFSKRLKPNHVKLITAFNFPKFTSKNGDEFFSILRNLKDKFDEIIYGMPILESDIIAYKESRIQELLKVKFILEQNKNLVLNVRVGATDFSSYFGVRRGVDYTIYDISSVRDCLSDILNILNRNDNDFVISAPVWEYFSVNRKMKFLDRVPVHLTSSLLSRTPIVDEAIDGLLREIILDKANGFVGKTVIHPSHIKFVNSMHAVTKEEFDDANQILQTFGGVIKSSNSNKMNEINPHKSWAIKIAAKAKAFGVIETGKDYIKLFWE